MTSIRKAKSTDFSIFLDLNREIQAIHAAGEPRLFRPAQEVMLSSEQFSKMAEDPKVWLYFAELNGSSVGYISCEVIEWKSRSYFLDGMKLYINHLAVNPACRGQGIGRLLLNHVLDKAKTQEIKRVELDVWAFNKEAKAFYEACGFRVFNERLCIEQ